MNKLKPSYDLGDIKRLISKKIIEQPSWRVLESLQKIGLTLEQAYGEILNLERANFYKSTDEFHNSKVWYDVYKKRIGNTPVYIKFKLVSDTSKFLLSSFKKDTSNSVL